MKNLENIKYLQKQTSQWKGRRLKLIAVGVNILGVKKKIPAYRKSVTNKLKIFQ
jgi:hypothetical protein